jgi:hypothetical protein
VASTLKVYMTMDPRSRRVAVQERRFGYDDFPPGPHGEGWPLRETEVPQQTWTKILRATLPPDAVDRAHRAWWDQARPEGAPLWPALPGDEET